jgi:hypothetical protein
MESNVGQTEEIKTTHVIAIARPLSAVGIDRNRPPARLF